MRIRHSPTKAVLTKANAGNTNLPQFTQTNQVNLYLFSATTQKVLLSFLNQTNTRGEAGVLSTPVNDSWWGDRGTQWQGSNVTFLYYWVVTRSDQGLADTFTPQAQFSAVRKYILTVRSTLEFLY